MYFLCNQKTLANAILNAQKAINNKTNIELLKGLLLTCEENKLTITGYDNEISIETSIEAQVKEEGSVVVNSKLLGDIVRKLPDSFVEINVDESLNVYITCLGSKYKIKGLDSSEFPRQMKISTDNMIKFNQREMKDMIRQTVFATAIEPINKTLAGGLLEIEDRNINLVALDGYRLAIRKSSLYEGVDKAMNLIIPGTTLNHINGLLSDEGDFYIGADEKNVIFIISNTKIVARLIDGVFTNYENVLPKEYITRVCVNKQKLQDAIERASLLLSSDKNNLIKINISEDMIVITSNNEYGNGYEEVDIDFEGEALESAFNAKYFIDGVKNINSEEIVLEFSGHVNPCIIKPLDGEDYTYLLLPVRV